jgi:hypothetical protein
MELLQHGNVHHWQVYGHLKRQGLLLFTACWRQ